VRLADDAGAVPWLVRLEAQLRFYGRECCVVVRHAASDDDATIQRRFVKSQSGRAMGCSGGHHEVRQCW